MDSAELITDTAISSVRQPKPFETLMYRIKMIGYIVDVLSPPAGPIIPCTVWLKTSTFLCFKEIWVKLPDLYNNLYLQKI